MKIKKLFKSNFFFFEKKFRFFEEKIWYNYFFNEFLNSIIIMQDTLQFLQ